MRRGAASCETRGQQAMGNASEVHGGYDVQPPCLRHSATIHDSGRCLAQVLRRSANCAPGASVQPASTKCRVAMASRRSSARKSGCAIEMSASARWRSVRPCRLTAPYSVTTQCT